MISDGVRVPDFIRPYIENGIPKYTFAAACYDRAFQRLAPVRPIPFTEMVAYYDRMPVPYSLEVFIEVMRGLEYDQIEIDRRVADEQKAAANKPKSKRR